MNKIIATYLGTFILTGIIGALIYTGIIIYLENGHKKEKAFMEQCTQYTNNDNCIELKKHAR